MKRVSNIYHKICDIDTIMYIYDKFIRLNTKNKRKIQLFEDYYCCNIAKIKETLITKTYIPGRYNIFLIHEPKARIIMSQEIFDKVINHLVAKYFLSDIFERSLSNRNCATRLGMGTHYALRRFKRDYNTFLNKYGKFYVLKVDIAKYFYNLDHILIKEMIRRKIKDKNALKILDDIIDSTDEEYVNKEIAKIKEIEKALIIKRNSTNKEQKLSEIDKIPLYEKGKGVCIGNMVSQMVATFYLDEIDKFIVDKLHVKAYGRYMDDFYLMSESKEHLKKCLEELKKEIPKLKLTINNKTKIYCSTENIEFLGFVFTSKNHNIRMKLTNKTKKKFKSKMKLKSKELLEHRIEMEQYLHVRNSYRGHLSYGNCYRLYQSKLYF